MSVPSPLDRLLLEPPALPIGVHEVVLVACSVGTLSLDESRIEVNAPALEQRRGWRRGYVATALLRAQEAGVVSGVVVATDGAVSCELV